jgi:hypothetical protein
MIHVLVYNSLPAFNCWLNSVAGADLYQIANELLICNTIELKTSLCFTIFLDSRHLFLDSQGLYYWSHGISGSWIHKIWLCGVKWSVLGFTRSVFLESNGSVLGFKRSLCSDNRLQHPRTTDPLSSIFFFLVTGKMHLSSFGTSSDSDVSIGFLLLGISGLAISVVQYWQTLIITNTIQLNSINVGKC